MTRILTIWLAVFSITVIADRRGYAQDQPLQLKASNLRELYREAQSQGLTAPIAAHCRPPLPNCVPTHCLPCFCLQSILGTGALFGLDLDTGAFTVAGLARGAGVFTVNKTCYRARMRFAGHDQSYWYYWAYGTPFYFAISKQAYTSFNIHFMFLCDCSAANGFKFYQLMRKYNCPGPCWPCVSSSSCYSYHAPRYYETGYMGCAY